MWGPIRISVSAVRVGELHSSVLHPEVEHAKLLPWRTGGPLGITGLGPKVLAPYSRQLPWKRHVSRDRIGEPVDDCSRVGDPIVK